jgi:hypothetical protein
MRSIQNAVSRSGYTRFVTGFVNPKNAKKLVCKFEDRYGISLTKQQRWYRKKKGEAQTKLFLLQKKNSEQIQYFLLVSDGDGLVVDLEKLSSFTSKKSRLMLDGFEFLRLNNQGRESWTWRLTKEKKLELKERIRKSVTQKRDKEIEQIVFELRIIPPFPECRQQVRFLVNFLNACYLRTYKDKKEFKVFKGYYGGFKSPRLIEKN